MQNKRERGQRGGNRPFMMYNLPELYDVENRLCGVDEMEVQLCAEETLPKEDIPCDATVKELSFLIMEEESLQPPEDAAGAKELYRRLRSSIISQL